VDREWITLSDHRKRSTAILVIVAVILTVFIGRLVELQAFRGSALASEATNQRLKEISLPATRGAITDAAGNPLAVTVQAYNVTADQTLIADPVAAATAMAPILAVDPAALAARLTGDRRFVYVAKNITPENWQRIADLGLPGILKEGTSKRVYPRPEDRMDGDIEEADPEYGFFSPHSWWPLALGVSVTVVTIGLIFAVWVIVFGVFLLFLSLVGWLFEYYRGEFAH
jgi:hypothetical protein